MTGQEAQWQTETVAFMTLKEVAEELSLDPSSVRRLIASGALRAINVAPAGAKRPTIRIDRAEVDRLIAERGIASEDEA